MYGKQFLIFVLIGAASTYPNPDPKSTKNTDKPIVATPLGKVQGSILASRLGKQIFAFRGIRYAKPPTGDLRFQPPQPADKWENVYNATQDGVLCPQPTDEPTSEDCLFINVYTTKLPKGGDEPKRSVIVFIHGGGFYSTGATSNWLGPQYLLDQDIVLVTFNYRLGTLGFFSSGEEGAVGNYGFKDQVLALKWVKDNIAAFGGDPDCVTLAGQDAGAISVTLHLVSPLSRGLFHKAIAMSGSALGQLPYPIPHQQLELAWRQSKALECPDDHTVKIEVCLRKKSDKELGDVQPKLLEFGDDPVIIWTPVIEPETEKDRFLTAHPIDLINKGEFAKVPVLLGVTSEEFAPRAFRVLSDKNLKRQLSEEFRKYGPIAFQLEREGSDWHNICDSLKKFYLKDKPLDNSSVAGLSQLYSDALTGFGVNRAAKLLAEKSDKPVYYYRFNYNGKYSHFYLPDSNGTVPFGVTHNDDLIYLFYNQKLFPLIKDTDSEVQMVTKLTQLWANFAKTGNPIPEPSDKLDNVQWEPFTTKTQKYLDIGNKLVLSEKLYAERYAEWEKLHPLSKYTEQKKS